MQGSLFEFGKLVVTLGLAVWQAIEEGDESKTVGEIFDGVRSDASELERLEIERFGKED